MKVLFVTNLPSPYRVDFFNELGNKVDLTVCYERRNSSERDEKWVNNSHRSYKEKYIISKNLGVDRSIGLGVIKELKYKYDFVILTGLSSPSIILAIMYCQLYNIKYIMEDDGGLINLNGEKHKFLKKILLKKVFAYFTTTNENIYTMTQLGINKNKIYKYPFSSVFNKDIENGIKKKKKLQSIRQLLGIKEKKVVLAVGQFIERKGFDILLEAFADMPDDCGLYFVGGVPTKEYIDIVRIKKLSNIHFIGFQEKDMLQNYYAAADIFVHPTREDIWGLVVNEAMAAGLPVITTYRCGAGLELIKQNENGFLVEVENIADLQKKMLQILNNNNLQKKMEENSISIIKDYTIEKMVNWHVNKLKELYKTLDKLK